MMDQAQLEKLAAAIMDALNVDADTAGKIAADIGDTPFIDRDGNIPVELADGRTFEVPETVLE